MTMAALILLACSRAWGWGVLLEPWGGYEYSHYWIATRVIGSTTSGPSTPFQGPYFGGRFGFWSNGYFTAIDLRYSLYTLDNQGQSASGSGVALGPVAGFPIGPLRLYGGMHVYDRLAAEGATTVRGAAVIFGVGLTPVSFISLNGEFLYHDYRNTEIPGAIFMPRRWAITGSASFPIGIEITGGSGRPTF